MSPSSAGSGLYERFGGRAACRRLAVAFYARVERDPVLRPLFPGKSMTCAIEEFSAFLAQFLGGPGEDSQRRWWLSLRESHMRFRISAAERAAWLTTMAATLDDVRVEEPFRSELFAFFQRSSAHVVNQGSPVAEATRASQEGDISSELERRWLAHQRLDEAVAAIRAGDAERALQVVESPDVQLCGPTVLCGLLSLMIRNGERRMLEYVAGKLKSEPELVRERFAGRTLLHEAAAGGRPAIVELLLSLGADASSRDSGDHTPLYSVANECGGHGGAEVVRMLVRAGCDVNADDGVTRCTPLHMAARRGHLGVAEALLDCGADIEARDQRGDTPLRRAVNCNRTEFASLLVSRGANPHARGSRNSTPVSAAKTAAMKEALGSPRRG